MQVLGGSHPRGTGAAHPLFFAFVSDLFMFVPSSCDVHFRGVVDEGNQTVNLMTDVDFCSHEGLWLLTDV